MANLKELSKSPARYLDTPALLPLRQKDTPGRNLPCLPWLDRHGKTDRPATAWRPLQLPYLRHRVQRTGDYLDPPV